MSGLFPIVPTSTTSPVSGTVSVKTAGLTPVTRSTSARRSPPTRVTPGKSLALTTIGAALPWATRGNRPAPGVKTMQESVRTSKGM